MTENRLPPESKDAELTLPDVMLHMRTGQLIAGPVKPYKWMEYTSVPKSDMELKVQRTFESCTFKSAMSCVVGKLAVSMYACTHLYINDQLHACRNRLSLKCCSS